MITVTKSGRQKLDAAERYAKTKAAMAARSREASASGREIGELPAVVEPELRQQCEASLRQFLEICFPMAFRLGWCEDHLVLIAELQRVILNGGFRAIGMPRGTGKSTIVMRAMIWPSASGSTPSA